MKSEHEKFVVRRFSAVLTALKRVTTSIKRGTTNALKR